MHIILLTFKPKSNIILAGGVLMSNVNVTIRMDENLKKQAETLFGELGLNLSTAFNIFVRQAVREQSIPFVISNRQPNAETLAAIEEVQKMKES